MQKSTRYKEKIFLQLEIKASLFEKKQNIVRLAINFYVKSLVSPVSRTFGSSAAGFGAGRHLLGSLEVRDSSSRQCYAGDVS